MSPARLLVVVAGVHLVVGIGAALLLAAGRADALKPMKFGISIALFLGTMALLVPMLSVGPTVRLGLALVLALTMVAETAPIVVQAVRGTGSHFNTTTPFDAAMWRIMGTSILIATVAMLAVAVAASVRPLVDDGVRLDALRSTAWRLGAWLLLLAAVSGAAMGGRLRHGVGELADGAAHGLRLVGWSKTQGDLRVPHFIALHVFQAVPMAGAILYRLPLAPPLRWLGLLALAALFAGLALWTLLGALRGRPLLAL